MRTADAGNVTELTGRLVPELIEADEDSAVWWDEGELEDELKLTHVE